MGQWVLEAEYKLIRWVLGPKSALKDSSPSSLVQAHAGTALQELSWWSKAIFSLEWGGKLTDGLEPKVLCGVSIGLWPAGSMARGQRGRQEVRGQNTAGATVQAFLDMGTERRCP
jgi:hypothetical protein